VTDRTSLSQQMYRTLREQIILGRYPQGSRLPEQRIAEEMDVSRVPLREAVPLLERDGFVRTFPRRGAVVFAWDTKAVDDLFDVRLCLESGAARYAARRVAARAATATAWPGPARRSTRRSSRPLTTS
jgi:DNA-binding GntR family transcriptional regulator